MVLVKIAVQMKCPWYNFKQLLPVNDLLINVSFLHNFHYRLIKVIRKSVRVNFLLPINLSFLQFSLTVDESGPRVRLSEFFVTGNWIYWFLCASLHPNKLSKKSSKIKWSFLALNVRAFVILTTFCVEEQYNSHHW